MGGTTPKASGGASEIPLMPRAWLIDASTSSAPRLNPSGTRIAFLGPYEGARNVWIAPADDAALAVPLTRDEVATVRDMHWAENDQHLLLVRDALGNEKTRIDSLDAASGEVVSLTPCAGAETRLVALSSHYPDDILVESNGRDPAYFDVYRVNIRTGKTELVLRNDRFTWIYADHFLKPRLGELRLDDGSVSYCALDEAGRWQPRIHVPAEDEMLTRPFRIYETSRAFSADAAHIYAMDSRERDTAALSAWDLATGKTRLLAEHPDADITAVMVDPQSHEPIAWASEYARPRLDALEIGTRQDIETLSSDAEFHATVLSQSRDNQRWIVSHSAPHAPAHFSLFDRTSGKLTRLLSERPDLEQMNLGRMYPHIIKARDGLDLVCYATLPPDTEVDDRNRPCTPAPMVVLVHGGPWIRDSYTLDPWVQFLASRGYAVLNVNFRGSRGFGKAFLNAGDREWGARMLDDVVDATRWCIDGGIAAPQRVALMGASFGGYTTLMGMAREPQLFACGIDLFGVTNLESFLETIPEHWKALALMWQQRVGDWTTPEGRRYLAARSPMHNVTRIARPVLIAQGGNDPRVVQNESDQMVAALERNGVEVTYLLYPDEGHSFFQAANQLSFFAVVEAFLAHHLGGRCEAAGGDLARSSVIVAGARHIPGLEDKDASSS